MLSGRAFRRLLSNECPAVSTSTGNLEINALTGEERATIRKLPFFENKSKEQSKKKTIKAKQQYLQNKIPLTRAIFGEDQENSGYLSYHLPPGLPSPYYNVYTYTQSTKIKPRLSVTKLLTKRWCELRAAYDIYSDIGIFEHPQLLQGIASHQKLEDKTHPISEEAVLFRKKFEDQIPNDEFHKFVGLWFDNIIRLLNIFVEGEAREILCHGYLDPQTALLKTGSTIYDDDILISAIVDHLFLRKKGSKANITPYKLSERFVQRDDRDIMVILEKIQQNRSFMKDYEIVIGDVKTRSFHRIPTQENVIKSTKLQVMYYRFFLEELSNNVTDTYSKLLINAERRGFDVDRPIDSAKILSMMVHDNCILNDMRRLRDGVPIGFKLFDDINGKGADYDISYSIEPVNEPDIKETYCEFFKQWSRPVTLRYLAVRLAQVYVEVGALLSDTLIVEYYTKTENFHNTIFDYDHGYLLENCKDSAMFWLGQRDIEPITPNIPNISTYCKHCDYEDVCSWKSKGLENCLALGDELEMISEGKIE